MITELWFLLSATAAGLSLAMTGAWFAQRRTGQSGWIDVTWSFAVGAAGAALALVPLTDGRPLSARQILVAALALAWSFRLAAHIAGRSLRSGEDPRYHALKLEWGSDFSKRLFWFLQIQAACAFLLSLTIFLAARNPAPFGQPQDFIGAALLVVAIAGEALADATLRKFRSDQNNKGRVCDRGLWGWSRHPNYFFEWLGWVAYAVIAIDFAGQWREGWRALAGPLFMYWLLAHVSGVPPLERHMLLSRGDAFRAYQKQVNVFFPGPRKRA
jgi:steroid 5-alpha reductase family enzyme